MSKLFRQLRVVLASLGRRLDEPLIVATAAAITGILLADVGIYAPVSAVAAIVLGVGFFLQSGRRTFLLLAVAGAFALSHDARRRAVSELAVAEQILGGQSLLVEVEGIVDTIPKASANSRPGRVSFFLTLTRFRQIGSAGQAAAQRIYVSARADPPPAYGDLLKMRGYLRAPKPARNPGEFDFRRFLERKGVIAQLSPSGEGAIQILGGGHGNPVLASAAEARRWVAQTLTRDLAGRDPEVAGVLTAMTLGTRSDTRDEIIESFRTSGTLHIFAVSGLHVGLIGIILWQLLTPLPISRRICALTIILVLCSYAFVTGLRPSAVRATIMATLVLGAPLFNREPRVINSLGAAGLAILAYDSNQLFLPGFQLSFAVLLALTLLHKPILALLLPVASPDPFLPAVLLTDFQRLYYRFARAVAETFAVSVAAWLGSLPLMIYHFHLITPIAPIANLFLIPAAFCVLGTAILSVLAASLSLATVSAIFNNANFLLASTLTATAGFFADLPVPASHFYATAPPAALRPPCQITVLDIPGGGASTLIATACGTDWLVDTGNARNFRQTVATTLHEHAGVTRLDTLLLTHADAAHIGAASDVIDSFQPETVYAPAPNNSSSTYRRLAARLASYRGKTLTPQQNHSLRLGEQTVAHILYPPPGLKPRLGDDACLVFLLESHGWSILFTGDAGFAAEKSLLDTHARQLRADLIIRGNHSADHSGLPDFLTAVQPAAIIANARSFEANSPDENIWRRAMDRRGIELFDQEETGAVSIEIHPRELRVHSFLTDQSLTLKRAR